MVGQMRHFSGHHPRYARVVEDDDGAGYPAMPVMDGRGGTFDGSFKRIAADKDAVRGQADGSIFLNCQVHRICSGFARNTVDDTEHFGKRPV